MIGFLKWRNNGETLAGSSRRGFLKFASLGIGAARRQRATMPSASAAYSIRQGRTD